MDKLWRHKEPGKQEVFSLFSFLSLWSHLWSWPFLAPLQNWLSHSSFLQSPSPLRLPRLLLLSGSLPSGCCFLLMGIIPFSPATHSDDEPYPRFCSWMLLRTCAPFRVCPQHWWIWSLFTCCCFLMLTLCPWPFSWLIGRLSSPKKPRSHVVQFKLHASAFKNTCDRTATYPVTQARKPGSPGAARVTKSNPFRL